MKTKFLDAIQKGAIAELAAKGDIKPVLDELDRLENRIRQLELGLELAVDKYSDNRHRNPPKIN